MDFCLPKFEMDDNDILQQRARGKKSETCFPHVCMFIYTFRAFQSQAIKVDHAILQGTGHCYTSSCYAWCHALTRCWSVPLRFQVGMLLTYRSFVLIHPWMGMRGGTIKCRPFNWFLFLNGFWHFSFTSISSLSLHPQHAQRKLSLRPASLLLGSKEAGREQRPLVLEGRHQTHKDG